MSQPYDFIKDRLDDQIKFYSKKSKQNKSRYLRTQVIIITLGVLIPIINFFPIVFGTDNAVTVFGFRLGFSFFLFVSAIISSIIGLTAAMSQLNKYYENWLNYRSILELLKREKSLFMNGAGGYFRLSETDKKRVFVDKVERSCPQAHKILFVIFAANGLPSIC